MKRIRFPGFTAFMGIAFTRMVQGGGRPGTAPVSYAWSSLSGDPDNDLHAFFNLLTAGSHPAAAASPVA